MPQSPLYIAPSSVLTVFLSMRLLQHVIETWLSNANHKWWSDHKRQVEASSELGISEGDMATTVRYTTDKYHFGRVHAVTDITVTLCFIALGGFGFVERFSTHASTWVGGGTIVTGLFFLGSLSMLSALANLPFTIYQTFVIEQKYGYNKQTPRGFVADLLKGIAIAVLIGSAILSLILWIMEIAGSHWWIFAWAATTLTSLAVAWIYPTLLAPLFNKFTPLEDGELKSEILKLAQKVGFKSDGIYKMDASKRSGHGNAYFTGLFGKKRIVLFDTLINSMTTEEVVAVMAHELGHFKLHHVRESMIRGVISSFLTFAGIGYMLPREHFYLAFHLQGVTNYGYSTCPSTRDERLALHYFFHAIF